MFFLVESRGGERSVGVKIDRCTSPKTNMAPEDRLLEKEIPALEIIIFRVYVCFRGCICMLGI